MRSTTIFLIIAVCSTAYCYSTQEETSSLNDGTSSITFDWQDIKTLVTGFGSGALCGLCSSSNHNDSGYIEKSIRYISILPPLYIAWKIIQKNSLKEDIYFFCGFAAGLLVTKTLCNNAKNDEIAINNLLRENIEATKKYEELEQKLNKEKQELNWKLCCIQSQLNSEILGNQHNKKYYEKMLKNNNDRHNKLVLENDQLKDEIKKLNEQINEEQNRNSTRIFLDLTDTRGQNWLLSFIYKIK